MPVPLAVTRFNKRYTNKVLIHLAGHSSFVELEHVGRKTGTPHRIPLNAFRSGDGTTITCLLPYGPRVDWYRNVRAASGCRMRLKGQLLTLGAPRTLPTAEGRSRMPLPARVILRLAKVSDFIELPVLSTEPFRGWDAPR